MTTVTSRVPVVTLMSVVRRQWLKMLVVFVLIMALAVTYTAISPVLYTSEAKLLVRLGRETMALDPTATTGQTVNLQETRENEINSIYELLKSRSLAEQLVDIFGTKAILGIADSDACESCLDKPAPAEAGSPGAGAPGANTAKFKVAALASVDFTAPGPVPLWKKLNPLATYSVRDTAIRKLSQRLRVDPVRKSSIINLACDASDPALAQMLVAKAIELTRATHIRVNRTDGSFDFFNAQSKEQARYLAKLEDRWRDLKNRTGIASVDEQRGVLLRRVATLEDNRLRVAAGLAAAQADIGARGETLAALPAAEVTSETVGQPQTAASRMREQLFTLELKQQDLLSRFDEDAIPVKQIREQIVAARAVLAEEVEPVQTTKSLNHAHQQNHVALLESTARTASLEAELGTLEEQLVNARIAMAAFNDAELELVRLEREIELEKSSYAKNAANRELARIDQALQEHSISNLNILQAPSYSVTPTKLRVLVNLALGLVLSSIASCGVAGWAELRQCRSTPAADPLERTSWHVDDYAERAPIRSNETHHGNGNGNGWFVPHDHGLQQVSR